MAVIASAHGIKGEVTLKSFTENPADFTHYGDLVDNHGSPFVFSSVRVTPKMVIARVEGVTTRNEAEALRSTYIYAAENMRPELDETEAYLDELVGMAVQREDGSAFGTIKSHFDNGAQIVLEIKHPEAGNKDILIPFTDDMIDSVNHADRILIVTDFADQMAEINAS